MSAPIIALTGAAGAGKDTVASIILAASPQTRAIAFADALRHEVAQAWGIDHRVLTERATKEKPTSALCIDKCGECGFQLWFSNPWPLPLPAEAKAPRSPRWVMQNWGSYQRSKNDLHYVNIVRGQLDRWLATESLRGHRRAHFGSQRVWTAPGHPVPARVTHPPRAVVTDLRFPQEAAMLRALGAKVIRITRPESTDLSQDTAAHTSEQHQALQADAVISNHGTLHHITAAVAQALAQLAQHTAQPNQTADKAGVSA